MMKVEVEWLDSMENGIPTWLRETAKLKRSLKGNFYFKIHGPYETEHVFVCSKLEEGVAVITKEEDEWVVCGRVDRSLPCTPRIFIGSKDEPSRREYSDEAEEDYIPAFFGVDLIDDKNEPHSRW